MNRHAPRFDLREVEHLADEREQLVAAALDQAGRLDLLLGEVALVVVQEPFGQQEHAVERGAKLVGHVGEELGLELAGRGQIDGPALALLRRGLQLLLLLREELVGLLQLFVRGPELPLGLFQAPGALLQLLGEGLRLRQRLDQPLPPLGDGQREGDRGRRLREVLEVEIRKRSEGPELEHAADLALVNERGHAEAVGGRLAEEGGDCQVARGHVRDEDLPLVERGLTRQPLPDR